MDVGAGRLGLTPLVELLPAAFSEGWGLGCALCGTLVVSSVSGPVVTREAAAVQPATLASPWRQEASLPPLPADLQGGKDDKYS